jgi:hypothetical protein
MGRGHLAELGKWGGAGKSRFAERRIVQRPSVN